MTSNRSGSNYSIQSNGSGPGHSSHKSKRQEFQPIGESQMENSRASTSSQRLSRIFNPLIDSKEADITAINVVRCKQLSAGSSGNIPVSIQELGYGSKEAGVGTSSKLVDMNN
ncbi:hypothetical protein O181_034510 [Austropuccinia psidii MF-1]|uniref:Uncharacterized protein n=1 Tax=Austropuccinia psidii MF-1 TaxID=1389203 RepID=A0A9Q3D540_9BASI|nr:hypothetical protein [Austropuccinia psidii MF-1]